MSTQRVNVLAWFSVLGGPVAWATQHVAGFGIAQAQCNPGVGQIPVHPLDAAFSAVALAVAVCAEGSSIWLFVRTGQSREVRSKVLRGFGGEPPVARLQFLAVVGIVGNLLAILIIVFTGVAAPLHAICRQS